MMAGDNEPNQNMDDDLDIVNEDTNQGNTKIIYNSVFLNYYCLNPL